MMCLPLLIGAAVAAAPAPARPETDAGKLAAAPAAALTMIAPMTIINLALCRETMYSIRR